jgi:gliding motility-associated transport system ATP-binding protein
MLEAVLQLAGITKAFGARTALAGVTLAVAAGEVVLLVGLNGAGKTTLLRIATGFLDPDAGTAAIDGLSLASQRVRAQRQLGYLPEHAPAPPELTVREHLTLRARLKRASRASIDTAMAAAAVTSEAGRRIGTLSKGYRQRVGLADALLGDPPVLILDEPTSGMDPIQTRELREHLAAAASGAGKRAVLISSHAVADLEPLATRIAVLTAGSLVAEGTRSQLLEQTNTTTLDDAVVALLGTVSSNASYAPEVGEIIQGNRDGLK